METSDIFGLLPTLFKIVGDKIVGFDDRIRKRFNHAIENALKPNDESYINKVQVHLAELIGLIILVMDEPSSINTITMPNYISRDEFRRLYDQTKKDEYLWRVIQEEWNQYKAKDTNNIVKTTYNLIVDRISSEEDIKQGIEKIIEILEETKINKGSDMVDKGLTFDDFFKEKLLQKRDNHPSFKLMDIEDDLSPDGMITFEFETEALDSDNQLKSVKDIVAESWNKQDRNHLMIEGKGGIGKTVTLLRLPDKLAPHYVPAVYIPLHELKGETNTIEKYIKSQILDYNDNEARFGQLMDSVGKPWNNGPRLLMLLDGFNEIPNERRADISLDIEHWSERPGVQIITSSRYDIRQYVALSSSFSKIELQPLKEEKVEAYLKKTGFDVPESPTVINLITTPLLLTLYIRTEKLRINRKSPLADFRETKNAGLLIWNYLQSELWRYRTQKEEAKACVLAMEFIAPYIAWTMQQHTDFVLNEDDFLDRLDEAYELLKVNFGNTMKLPKHIKTTLKQTSGQLPEYPFVRDLLQEQLSLFNRQERKDANNNTVVEYRLMHQQFRDALAAMHLNNSIYLNGDSRPAEWNSPVDYYVMQFVADLISEDEANRLWEQNRTSPQLKTATRNQLELQRRLHNCDFSNLNFSGLDLRNISLYPYRAGNVILKLPTEADAMREVKISEKTFSPEGHTDSVIAMAVTPDGKRIVSGSRDRTIRIWDLDTGEPIGKPIKNNTWLDVPNVFLTPDGKRIVGESWYTIYVWDIETGDPIGKPIILHRGLKKSFMTPNGKCIILWSYDGTISIWDLESGNLIRQPIEVHQNCACIDMSPDGKYIVGGYIDGAICVWDLKTGDSIGKPIKGYKNGVNKVTVTQNSTRIISGYDDGAIRVWDLKTGMAIGKPINEQTSYFWRTYTNYVVTPNNKYIVELPKWGGYINAWDLETGIPIWRYKKHVDSVILTQDGKHIIIKSDNVIRVLDLETFKPAGKPIDLHERKEYTLFLTPDFNYIVSWLRDDTICVWDLGTGNPIGKPIEKHEDAVRAIAVTQDSEHLVIGYDSGAIRVWNLITGEQIGTTIIGHKDGVSAIGVTFAGEYIVSGLFDHTIRVWNLKTCTIKGNPIEGHKGKVNAIAVTKDGEHIVSGSDDKTIRVWNLNTNEQIGPPIEGHEEKVIAIAITTDGGRIVSGSADQTIRIWDLNTGDSMGKPIKGRGWINAVAVTNDDNYIVSGSGNSTIRVWNVKTGVPIGRPIKGHEGEVYSVVVPPDGNRIISGSKDGTIRIWDLKTGDKKGRPIKRRVSAFGMTSDGNCIISGSEDGFICVWDLKARILIGKPIKVHKGRVNSVAMTADCEHIVSGSDDGTICITNTKTHEIKTIHIHPLSFVGLDFSKAIISTPELKETLRQNGAKVDPD